MVDLAMLDAKTSRNPLWEGGICRVFCEGCYGRYVSGGSFEFSYLRGYERRITRCAIGFQVLFVGIGELI